MNQLTIKQHLRLIVKNCFLWCYINIYAPLRNLWRARSGTCHVAILLYHRVSNENLDSVTITPARFVDQLLILSRDYDLITMNQFLASKGKWRSRPAVVITFDDGYEDNYSAACILREHNIPCTFFISTGIVGTQRSFPMDLRLNRWLPVLTWEQIVEMSSWGFDIANHSVNHVDMGKISIEDSLAEIQTATQDIIDKLGQKDSAYWLAYPFGRIHNMKKEVLERLCNIDIGFCFSAYGGVNQLNFDPYDIVRQSVNHEFSTLAFRAIVEGYRARH